MTGDLRARVEAQIEALRQYHSAIPQERLRKVVQANFALLTADISRVLDADPDTPTAPGTTYFGVLRGMTSDPEILAVLDRVEAETLADPDTPTADDRREGFSERFAKEEPLPCAKCRGRGFFHWPSLADHTPTADAPADTDLRAKAEAARLWFPSDEHDGMDETPWMDAEWWSSAGLDERHAAFASAATPSVVLSLLDEIARSRAQVEAARRDTDTGGGQGARPGTDREATP